MRQRAFALLAVLAIGSLLASYAAAAGTVSVQVLDGDDPVEGIPVEIIASDGSQSGLTQADGSFTVEITGKYFRIRVQDTVLDGIYQIDDSPIVVDLNQL
ncbi:MAG: hypothetical protein GF355_18100 [Candidatus Eisenbacteria bacterium]|nr:hypothetical protein [Candidatus Eisenbacteria bacterium]